MDAFMCYGPVVPDGYGVCYNPHPYNIVVCIAAFQANTETQADYFAYTLEGSFLQMQELCLKTNPSTNTADPEKLRNAAPRNTQSTSSDAEKLRNTASKNSYPQSPVNKEIPKKQTVRQRSDDKTVTSNGHVNET